VGVQRHAPRRFTPGKTQYPLCSSSSSSSNSNSSSISNNNNNNNLNSLAVLVDELNEISLMMRIMMRIFEFDIKIQDS
jgi:hypothetical protein